MDIEATAKQFQVQMDCARDAGVYDAMFLAFGSLLGHCRDNGFIEGDDDMDMGIVSEMISVDQAQAYISNMKSAGLGKYRWETTANQITGMPFWCSIRGGPPEEVYKCCNWFFFEHKGFSWHHKGPGSLIKGCPANLVEIGPEVEFLGVTVHVPRWTGALLEFWYTDWCTKRLGGCSEKKVVMKVKDWSDKRGWKVETR